MNKNLRLISLEKIFKGELEGNKSAEINEEEFTALVSACENLIENVREELDRLCAEMVKLWDSLDQFVENMPEEVQEQIEDSLINLEDDFLPEDDEFEFDDEEENE